jgi:hypothetical protein
MPDRFDQHYDERNEEHDDGDPVHAVHQLGIGVQRFGFVALFDVEILQYLAPDAFHTPNIHISILSITVIFTPLKPVYRYEDITIGGIDGHTGHTRFRADADNNRQRVGIQKNR